ncbi:unnamed protein product, partial [Durusdinium trenchii]
VVCATWFQSRRLHSMPQLTYEQKNELLADAAAVVERHNAERGFAGQGPDPSGPVDRLTQCGPTRADPAVHLWPFLWKHLLHHFPWLFPRPELFINRHVGPPEPPTHAAALPRDPRGRGPACRDGGELGHCFVATGSLGRPRAVEHMARQAAGGPYLGMGEEQGARRLETLAPAPEGPAPASTGEESTKALECERE